MSTAGKVLVILVLLAVLPWLWLAAGVAQHHINWAKLYAETEKQRNEAKAELPPLESAIYEQKNEATVLQVSLDKQRRNFRGQMAMEQKEESETKETLSRTDYQLKQAQLEAENAKKRHDIRRQEKLDLDKAIADEQVVVQDLMNENKALKERLANLEKDFLATVEDNKKQIDRIRKKAESTSGAKPRTRLGSLVR